MIIWFWLFAIIWWLFDPNYLWLFVDYLIPIIRDYSWLFDSNYSWLFVIIWFMGQQQVGCLLHSQKPSHGTAWWWLPFACENHSLRVLPAACCWSYVSVNNPLLSHADIDPPSALTRAACQKVLDPAITQFLAVSRTQLTNLVCDRVALIHPCAFRDFPVDSNL